MFKIGDLVYLNEKCLNSTMWWSLMDTAFIVTSINKQTTVLVVSSPSEKIYVFPDWIEKCTMEEYAEGNILQKELAEKYNVCRPLISDIINNKMWKET